MLRPIGFTILQLIGLWQPIHWQTKWSVKFYQIYSLVTITYLYIHVLSDIIELFRIQENLENFINDLLVFLSMLGCSIKATNILNQRYKIVKLITKLSSFSYLPQDQNEELILQEFDKSISTKTIINFSIVVITATLMQITFFKNGLKYILPFKAWVPLNLSNPITFWTIYSFQSIGSCLGATINTAYDTLVASLILQVCAQLSIFKYRLSTILKRVQSNVKLSADINKKEAYFFANFVKHHCEIFQFAKTLNKVFGIIFFAQFLISTFVICVTVYSMSQLDFGSSELPPRVMYLLCMLYQLFLFCHAGSEVITKSTEINVKIHTINWYLLNNSTQKGLLIIMLRSLKPIKFTTGFIIDLSMESYTQMMLINDRKINFSITF
ncbi:odorant receptor Or1-like [Chelonus insularis]|uniref:odorant receptor Or1-like n=1 Tax=Chelonus insularis TaxID=460826 RepID=UPI001588E617|nr:odorant receptor Or1-like [Chelonus insularis]